MDFVPLSVSPATVVRAGPYHGWRACPLGQPQEHWHFPHLPREQHAKLMSSVAVTDVTGCSRDTFIFWTGLKCKSPNAAGSEAAEVRIALGQRQVAMLLKHYIMI